MARLFGCICNQPARLAQALEPVRTVLRAKAPISRWGIGYVQGGEVLLSLSPRRSDQDVDLYEHVHRLRSDYLIAHAASEDGLSGNSNTQPFRYRRWLYAQEGAIEDIGRLQQDMLDSMPDFLRRNLKGKTPGEHLFYVFMSQLHATKSIDDPNLPLGRAREALAHAVAHVRAIVERAGVSDGIGNLITSNARSLIAVRLSTPLYMRRLTVPSSDRPKAPKDSTFKGILAVSADEHPGEGFEELPEHSALLVSRDIGTEIVSIRA